jgi:hypothetical protein
MNVNNLILEKIQELTKDAPPEVMKMFEEILINQVKFDAHPEHENIADFYPGIIEKYFKNDKILEYVKKQNE